MAYWWQGKGFERYWVEIRWVEGIGRFLTCPGPPVDGRPHNPWYQLVGQVQPDDVIYHWNAVEHRFVGRSRVASSVRQEGEDWVVALKDFAPLRVPVYLSRVRALEQELTAIRDRLAQRYGDPLYLPFQYRSDGLRLMSNYFAKLPADAVVVLFDSTELAEQAAEPPAAEEGAPVTADAPSPARTRFLAPFRPKADTEYLARLQGGIRRRGRKHESLVNGFAVWLETRGYDVGRNAAVDLGLTTPPVVIEAKIVSRWPDAIRAAVGQLYEYRYFRVADPESRLLLLASDPVPNEWLQYLERDRQIGAAWPDGKTFMLSSLAKRALAL